MTHGRRLLGVPFGLDLYIHEQMCCAAACNKAKASPGNSRNVAIKGSATRHHRVFRYSVERHSYPVRLSFSNFTSTRMCTLPASKPTAHSGNPPYSQTNEYGTHRMIWFSTTVGPKIYSLRGLEPSRDLHHEDEILTWCVQWVRNAAGTAGKTSKGKFSQTHNGGVLRTFAPLNIFIRKFIIVRSFSASCLRPTISNSLMTANFLSSAVHRSVDRQG
jgi:hypothetical protein